jgi:hypothetical protein
METGSLIGNGRLDTRNRLHYTYFPILGHYTMAAIAELEMKYAKEKRSNRTRKGY